MRALRLGLVGCGVLLWPTLLLAQLFDSADTSNSLDGRPSAMVIADVNGDGFLDVVTTGDSGTITLLAGDGTGLLSSWGSFPAGSVPMGLAIADFDGDGNPDAVVTNANAHTVSFLKGFGADNNFELTGDPIVLPGVCTGDLTRTCNADLPSNQDECKAAGVGTCSGVAGLGPVAAKDLNGDGIMDLAVVSEGNGDGDGKLSLLFGNGAAGLGDGTFTAVAPRPTGSKTNAVLIDDFNGDGFPDVVVANGASNNVSVFLGDGTGNFGSRLDSPIGAAPSDIALGDIDGDGHLDLLVASATGITVMLGDSLHLGQFTKGDSFTAGNTPIAVALKDMDGDGHLDAIVANNFSSDVSVLLGDGHGGFARARTFVADQDPLVLAIGDLNSDGRPDVVTGNNALSGPDAAVLLNRGSGRLVGVEDIFVGSAPAGIAAGDVDNDGLPDLAVTLGSGATGYVRVYLARTNGNFVALNDLAVGNGPHAVSMADFNGDGNVDLAVVNNLDNTVSILLGHGDGTFDVQRTFSTAAKPFACVVGDFDNNRIPDLAVASVGEPGSVSILLGDGHGGFHSAGDPIVVPKTSSSSPSLAAGHFTGGSFQDLAVGNSDSNDISILLGQGDGTFIVGTVVPVGRQPVAIGVLDVNRDGLDDLAVVEARETPTNVAVYVGDGTGAFTPWGSGFSAGSTPSGLVAQDFAGSRCVGGSGAGLPSGSPCISSSQCRPGALCQQLPDLVVSNAVSNDTSMLVNVGSTLNSNLFGAITVSRRPQVIVAADFNGDGRYDVATGNAEPTSTNISVLNNSGGTPVLRGDGNGDGRVSAADLVAAQVELTADKSARPEDATLQGKMTPGVDANGDGVLTPQDTRATALRIFLGS